MIRRALLLAALLLGGCSTVHVPVSMPAWLQPSDASCPAQVPAAASAPAGADAGEEYDLALSGGGYRAMLFHVGAMWRLHELGMLAQVRTVSSVSGGSVAAAMVAMHAQRLAAEPAGRTDCYRKLVAEPLLRLVRTSVDWRAALEAVATGRPAGNVLAGHYQAHLFGDFRLAELPRTPTFLFHATNLHTGSLWSFTRSEMGDPEMGYTPVGTTRLAEAVAASSSFPPVLSPFEVKVGGEWTEAPREPALELSREYRAHHPSARERTAAARMAPALRDALRQRGILLTDGGVADNLGTEGLAYASRDILISDGGAPPLAVLDPPTSWIGQLAHVTGLIHNQPSQVRHTLLINGFRERSRAACPTRSPECRDGAYWAIGTRQLPRREEPQFRPGFAPRADAAAIERLSTLPTRLAGLSAHEARELVNLGYHMADWHIPYLNRRMAGPGHAISCRLPFAEAPLWREPGPQQCAGEAADGDR